MQHFGWPRQTFGVVGGHAVEEQLLKTMVHRGFAVNIPTNASTGTSSAYDFNVAVGRVVLTIDGTPYEIEPSADYDLTHASEASPLAAGESIIYSLVAWKSKGDGVIRTAWFAGDIAVDADCVRAAIADIEATMVDGTTWMILGETKIHQDDATTIVQTYNNTTAPVMVPDYTPLDL